MNEVLTGIGVMASLLIAVASLVAALSGRARDKKEGDARNDIIDRQRTEIADLREEIRELKNQRRSDEKRVDSLETRLAQKDSEIEEMTGALEKVRANEKRLRERVAVLEGQLRAAGMTPA